MTRSTRRLAGTLLATQIVSASIGAPASATEEQRPPDEQPAIEVTHSPAQPMSWGREGFSIHLAFVSDNIGAEDPGPTSSAEQLFVDEHGGGAYLRVAYGFTPSVALGLSLAGAPHATTIEGQEVIHGTAAFDLRYTFLAHERARPYLEGGLGGATLVLDAEGYNVEVRGAVALLGAGVVHNLTPHLLLSAGARLEFINWTEISVRRDSGGETLTLEDPVEDDGGAVKLLFGAGWAF